MTAQEIYDLISPYINSKIIVSVCFVIAYIIDKSEIKLNPLKFIGKLMRRGLKELGNVLTEDVRSELNDFKKQYDSSVSTHINSYKTLSDKIDSIATANASLELKLDNHVAESMRRDILDFQNACLNKRKHTKEEFTYIYRLCDKYERYIEDNDLDNSEAEEAIHYIRTVYRDCLESGAFIMKGEIKEGN